MFIERLISLLECPFGIEGHVALYGNPRPRYHDTLFSQFK